MQSVSVIVPVYNVAKHLEKCIQSIVQQDYSQFEILLIDDGSTDRSGEICDDWAKRYDYIKVIHKKNGGQSEARNVGIDRAKGEYITFVDADDYLEPDNIRILTELLEQYHEADIAQANHYVHRKEKIKLEYDTCNECFLTRAEAFRAVLYHDNIDVSPWNKIYRKRIFNTLRFPVGRIYEDTSLFGKLLLESNGMVYCGKPLYHYVIHEGSTVHNGFDEKQLDYINATHELTKAAMQEDPGLWRACARRTTHAYLSILRYMEDCEVKDLGTRNDLKSKALMSYDLVTNDPDAPDRDKVALRLLKLGFSPFYAGWRLYGKFRR